MKTRVYLSVICALAVNLVASDLGTIQVESSTIDDKTKSTKNEVSNVTVFTSEDVEEINPHSILEVLRNTAGITATQTEGDIVKIHIRGVGNHLYMGEQPGVAVVIDGVPVQESAGTINVDLDNVASIKVIKGGASYLYGNDALAGAVVITTKRAKGKDSSKIEIEGGSFGTKRALISTNKNFDNSALQIQASYRESDGFWDRSWSRIKSVNGKYSYYIDDSSDITFGLDLTKRDSGDGSGVHGTDRAKVDPKSENEVTFSSDYDATLIKTFLTYSKDFEDNSNLMFNVYHYSDHKKFQSGYGTEYAPDVTMVHDFDVDDMHTQNGIKSEYRKSFDSIAIMAGLDIQKNTFDVEETLLPTAAGFGLNDSNTEADEDIYAAYVELKYQATDELTTTFNVRHDNISHELTDVLDGTNNISKTYDETSYRAGLNYKINTNSSIYTSISTGFRAPTAYQISSNLSSGYSTDVDPETTYNYEIGYRATHSMFTYDLAIFQLDRKDYIGREGGSYLFSSDEDNAFENVGDMRSRGIELSLNSDKKKKLSFNLAYTYLDAYFTNYTYHQKISSGPSVYVDLDLSGKTIPRTSRHTLNLTVDYKPTTKLTITPELVAKSSYYADEANEYKQSGYAIVNMRGLYKVNESLELFAKIDNLLDKDYYQFVNMKTSDATATMQNDATVIVAPGISGYAGIRVKF